MAATWLKDTVFYEIYPQSFYDTNGDGIGDFNGIIEKLDYIKSLGCNALWINPCFDSPFADAGYDVRDYKKVAPRYGCNNDLYRLFGEAHKRGIKVLLDLVPGHTSEEHEWFRQSQKAEKNEYSNRYIWSDFCFQRTADLNYIGGESERSGTYALNFFKCQPALNYGFLNPEEPWQLPIDHPDCIATREAIKDVMRFWLDHGCDGFRVDMAGSLVKHDDEKQTGTSAVWLDIRKMLDEEYPEAAMVAEWSRPSIALRAGYDMDFYLNHPGNGYSTLMRDYFVNDKEKEDNSFFKKDSDGDINRFLDEYVKWYEDTKDIGYISMLTCNHDTNRPRYTLEPDELKIAYAFIFTMPGVPFLYYGDEIGMRYLELPTKEGGYYRTGSRTPMQWNKGKNLGFSEGCKDSLYLPVDEAEDAPTVEEQEKDKDSLLNVVKELLNLRHREEDLQADADFKVLCAEKNAPFVYKRGSLTIAVNPSDKEKTAALTVKGEKIYSLGNAEIGEDKLTLSSQSFVVIR
ncbi:alpha-amylase family glycosyl hydrolase [Butyrivibrio sp. LC3010]|uniref:alpha-amylase family glycosyl hydrolase n=1 Tax=Butyrivibrio sp. LC3010 TaxID=1280680 RepID=UPI000415C0C9|nr:alpha-amylase family glycosyl hydrolase [Butyrivibrio sp. LC3010]